MVAAQAVALGAGAPDQATLKLCISHEQADLDKLPQRDGCTQKVQRVDASTLQAGFPVQSQARRAAQSRRSYGALPEQHGAYTGQFQFNTTADGKPGQRDGKRASGCRAIAAPSSRCRWNAEH